MVDSSLDSFADSALRQGIMAMRQARLQETAQRLDGLPQSSDIQDPSSSSSSILQRGQTGQLSSWELDCEEGDEELRDTDDDNALSGGSAGHSGDDGASAEESTILGHHTIASLLNSSQSNSVRAPSNAVHHINHISQDSEGGESLPRASIGSAESKRTSRSYTSSPATTLSSGTRKAGGSRRSSILASPSSPAGPPPDEPLPELPSENLRRSSYQSSTRSSGQWSVHQPPSPSSPSFSGRFRSSQMLQKRSSPQSSLLQQPTLSHQASGEWLAGRRTSGGTGHSAIASQQDSSSLPPLTEQTYGMQNGPPKARANGVREESEYSSWTADLSGAEESDAGSTYRRDSSLQKIIDKAEQRSGHSTQNSLDELISALESGGPSFQESSPSPLRRENRASIDTEMDASDSGTIHGSSVREGAETSLSGFEFYSTATPQNGWSTTRSGEGSQAPVWRDARSASDEPPISNGTGPIISVDEVDSDDTISDAIPIDGPRKKQRQKRRPSLFGFDAQRAAIAAPGQASRSKNASSSASSSSKTAAPNKDQAAAFSYYNFAPDLPPFVPQGLKPMDLTGAGTWMSIAARAGGLTSSQRSQSSLSRASSYASTIQASNQQAPASPSGPVSMRRLAAQARAKQTQMAEYRAQQADLLARKRWNPIDVHALAAEYHQSEAGSATASVYDEDPTYEGAAAFSTSASHLSMQSLQPETGVAFYFNPHRAQSIQQPSLHRQRSHRSEAAVGGDIASIASGRTIRQYREFSQQTTPPASPEPVRPSDLGEAAVGTDEMDEASPPEGHVGTERAARSSSKGRMVRRPTKEFFSSSSESEDDRRSTPVRRPRRRKSASGIGKSPSKAALDDPDTTWPLAMRAPRLHSRRSNIGSSLFLSAANTEESSDGTLSARRSPNGKADAHSADDSGSDESDLDLTTPLDVLATRLGALDAVVQSRGAKRKLKETNGATTHLIAPGTERAIAGTSRANNAVANSSSPQTKMLLSPGQWLSPPKAAKTRTGTPSGPSQLQQEGPSDAANSSLTGLLVPKRSLSFLRRSVSASPMLKNNPVAAASQTALLERSDSPDLESSFAHDSHSDDEDLMLSEMEFPAPVESPRPSRISNPAAHQSPNGRIDWSASPLTQLSARLQDETTNTKPHANGTVQSPPKGLKGVDLASWSRTHKRNSTLSISGDTGAEDSMTSEASETVYSAKAWSPKPAGANGSVKTVNGKAEAGDSSTLGSSIETEGSSTRDDDSRASSKSSFESATSEPTADQLTALGDLMQKQVSLASTPKQSPNGVRSALPTPTSRLKAPAASRQPLSLGTMVKSPMLSSSNDTEPATASPPSRDTTIKAAPGAATPTRKSSLRPPSSLPRPASQKSAGVRRSVSSAVLSPGTTSPSAYPANGTSVTPLSFPPPVNGQASQPNGISKLPVSGIPRLPSSLLLRRSYLETGPNPNNVKPLGSAAPAPSSLLMTMNQRSPSVRLDDDSTEAPPFSNLPVRDRAVRQAE